MARLIGTVGSSPGGGTPGAPTSVTATAGNAQATVSWTNPTYTGRGGTVTYRAVSSPGGFQATTTSNSVVVTGLSNGTAYTFTVRAETSYGINGSYSAASNSATPTVPLTVTGGTLTSDATYYYRTFTSNGTLGISGASLIADYVVISGGGAGCGSSNQASKTVQYISAGGGGGGSGVTYLTSQTLTANNYAITIGAGGTGPNNAPATNGTASTFNGYAPNGGGHGGNPLFSGGVTSGGSGGGGGVSYDYNTAGYGRQNGAAGATGGNAGGNGSQNQHMATGGGGGLGSAGGNPSGTSNLVGGAGGSGASYFGTTYGGGGGGAGANDGSSYQGPGGSGGGGTGGSRGANNPTLPTNGTANTGGGGGGAPHAYYGTNVTGGSGGSGVVVVRYTRAQVGG